MASDTEVSFEWNVIDWINTPKIDFVLSDPVYLTSNLTPEQFTSCPLIHPEGSELKSLTHVSHIASDVAANILDSIVHGPVDEQPEPKGIRDVKLKFKLTPPPIIDVRGKTIEIFGGQIIGQVTSQVTFITPSLKVLLKHNDAMPYVACAIAEVPNGNLMGVTFGKDRQLSYINIPLSDRLLRKIYRMKI
jgi:hypothetical protein